MSQSQRTLSGDSIDVDVDDDRAAEPADAEERTPFGAVYEHSDGERAFALHRCPACGVAVNPHRWASDRSVEGLAHHLLDKHDSLADFGGVDLHDDQRKLPLGGELLR